MPDRNLYQQAPYPEDLRLLVNSLEYRPGWEFGLYDSDRGQGCAGLTLDILTSTVDTYDPDSSRSYGAHHKMPVPAVNWDRNGWTNWLYEMCLAVETHECREFFRIDGKRVFAPRHGFRASPYSEVVDG